jgi:hypothetical protein
MEEEVHLPNMVRKATTHRGSLTMVGVTKVGSTAAFLDARWWSVARGDPMSSLQVEGITRGEGRSMTRMTTGGGVRSPKRCWNGDNGVFGSNSAPVARRGWEARGGVEGALDAVGVEKGGARERRAVTRAAPF